jgi:acetyl-CoA synthetase
MKGPSYSPVRSAGRCHPGEWDGCREEEGDERLEGQISDHVAKRIGRFARPRRVIWADDLPKTRSGKIMRRLLRDIAEGRELGDVTTLRDPGVMERLEQLVTERRDQEDGA